ncbi:DUF4280 domain-containing protein [Facilibium subflavum]|uniref:DUF4280 domain-containing protein n=1 Tax=Facilibium subflavum TaxID=2219058 RepID=UPI000E650B53|nr:DUF4280 domain-containing protein [Facilibium subflavum]
MAVNNKSPLTYFYELLGNKSVYEKAQNDTLTKMQTDIRRDIALSEFSANTPANDQTLSQLKQFHQGLSTTEKLSNISTSAETNALNTSLKQSLLRTQSALKKGDFQTFSQSKKQLASQIEQVSKTQSQDLSKLSQLRPSKEDIASSASYLSTLGLALGINAGETNKDNNETKPAHEIGDGSEHITSKASSDSDDLAALHQDVLRLNASSSDKAFSSLTAAYQQYLEGLSTEINQFSKTDQSFGSLVQYKKLMSVCSYPNSTHESVQQTPELLGIDRVIVNNMQQLSQQGQISLSSKDQASLASIDAHYQQLKALPAENNTQHITAHLQSLSQTTQGQTLQQVRQLQQTTGLWENIQKQTKDLKAKRFFTGQINAIRGQDLPKKGGISAVGFVSQGQLISADSLSAQLSSATASQQLVQKQQQLLNQLPDTPGQQIGMLQQQYAQMVATNATGIKLAQTQTGKPEYKALSQNLTAVQNRFSILHQSADTYVSNPNDLNSKANYQSALAKAQQELGLLQEALPAASLLQEQLSQQASLLHQSICPCAQMPSLPESDISWQIQDFSKKLDALSPEIQSPGNVQMPDPYSVTGPYSVAMQNAISQAKLPDVETTQAAKNAIDSLTQTTQSFSGFQNINMAPADCLCQNVSANLADIMQWLPTGLPVNIAPFQTDFITNALAEITNYFGSWDGLNNPLDSNISALIDQLMQQFDGLNQSLIQPLNFSFPPLINVTNLPPLTDGLTIQLDDLMQCLQSVDVNAPNLPDGVSLSQVQALQTQLQGVLNYQDMFFKLDRDHANQMLSEVHAPEMQKLQQLINEPGMQKPDINSLVPDIDKLLPSLSSCQNFNQISQQISNINDYLANAALPDIAPVNQSAVSYLDQVDSIKQSIAGSSIMHAKTPVASEAVSASSVDNTIAADPASTSATEDVQTAAQEKVAALDRLTSTITTYQVVSGNQSKAASVAVQAGSPESMMLTCATSQVMCSFAIAPGVYSSIRPMVMVNNKPAANINDHIPMVNLTPFPGCSSPTNPLMNPLVYPWPCMPMSAPFVPSNVMTMIQGAPVNTLSNKALCSYASGGVVSFMNPNQTTTVTS